MSTEFLLKWHNHKMDIVSVFDELLSKEALVDVTLACEDFSLKAHKIVLSACSPFFQKMFLENPCKHPVVFLKDVPYSDLKAIVEFMYKGETLVPQQRMAAFLKTARSLKVIGLTTALDEHKYDNNEQESIKRMPLHSETIQEKLNNKRKSSRKLKSTSINHQSLAKEFSESAVNPLDHDEPRCKQRLLKISPVLGFQHSLPILQAASSSSYISANVNMVKLSVDDKAISELKSNELQETMPETSISDCSQQSSKAETVSPIRICLDDIVQKKPNSLPVSPDAQSNVSCSSLSEKNSTFSTKDEIQEPISEISHADGKITTKVLKKLLKPQMIEPHNKSVTDHEPTVIYERINTEENSFVCDICGRTFPHSGFLRLHKRIHSGERPWACEICNESFTQFTYLIQHQKHHKEQINNKAQQLSDSSADVP